MSQRIMEFHISCELIFGLEKALLEIIFTESLIFRFKLHYSKRLVVRTYD